MSKSYLVKPNIYPDLLEQLLHNRGIDTKEKKDKFLNPDFIKHLHDPFLLPDMEKAVERILFAIDKNEKISIWSDYDADGIPGGALLHDFFKATGFNNFINYIPDRHDEGYGLNIEGIEKLKEENTKLLITVDCGIRDDKAIKYAKKLGIETIITDHHEPSVKTSSGKQSDKLPKAFAIINHKRKDSKYPENVLCGSGTIWKLIEGILQKRRGLLKEGQEKWLFDLVGLATLSDMVPLTGENRALSYFGLEVLRRTRRPGLRSLYSMLRLNGPKLTEDDVSFMITPRINAASRMGCPKDAFDLLVEKDDSKAQTLAKHLDKINNERKGIVASIVKEVKKIVENRFQSEGEKSVIVVGNPDWRPSLLGLVANSVAEVYNRPTFIWGRAGNVIKGSCRSDGETDLVAMMERANGCLLEFGGHKLSGGFAVADDKIHTLESGLLEASNHTVENNSEVYVDATLRVRDVSLETARLILKLAPFGVGNEKPIFIFYNIIPQKIVRFGKSNDHLLVTIRDGASTARAIGFFSSPDSWGDALKEGITTNLVATLELSYWNGNSPSVRLRIVDFFS